MPRAERARRLAPLADLRRRIAAACAAPVPLLAVRVPALERTAWREGLRQARRLEKRTSAAFVEAAARVLRTGDALAHDPASDVFIAALVAPTREGSPAPAPIDVRSALARMTATVELATNLDVESGWTMVAPACADDGDALVARALANGRQERERFAFFSAIGHELRTPLSSIRGYLETLRDEPVDAALRRRFVTVAYNETLRLGRLVDGMFEISLLDLQAAPDGHATARVASAIGAAADACSERARARDVRIDVGPVPALHAAADEDRLTLVLVNLMENAVKHGRRGGTVAVSAAGGRSVRIFVDDDGPGIAPAARQRIFRFGQRGTTGAPGSGIGLAIARLMLERCGGAVEARESPHGGARFVVTLPPAAPPLTECAE